MFDPIAALEAGYVRARDAEHWFRTVVDSVAPALDRGLGFCGYTVDLAAARLLGFYDFGVHPGVRAMIEEGVKMPARVAAVRARTAIGLFTTNEVFGVQPHPRGQDSLALAIPSGSTTIDVLLSESPRHESLAAEMSVVWERISLHLAAGRRLQAQAGTIDDPEVEAVLEPDGRLLHAPDDLDDDRRAQLRETARRIDRVRARGDRSDEALEIWHGLLLGRWSLVDQFDTDGRRFVVARRNDPDAPGPRVLSRRQRQVAFYAALGLPNTQIAYALGLAENTVSSHLAEAIARLGFRSRAELIQFAASLEDTSD